MTMKVMAAALMLPVVGFVGTAHAAPCDAAQTAQAQIYAENAARRVMHDGPYAMRDLEVELQGCAVDAGAITTRMVFSHRPLADSALVSITGVLQVQPDGEAEFLHGIWQRGDEVDHQAVGARFPIGNLPAEPDDVLGYLRSAHVDNACSEAVSVWLYHRNEAGAWQISGPLEVGPGGREAFTEPGHLLWALGDEALYHVESARGVWPGGDMQHEEGGRTFDLTRIEAGPDEFNIVLRCD